MSGTKVTDVMQMLGANMMPVSDLAAPKADGEVNFSSVLSDANSKQSVNLNVFANVGAGTKTSAKEDMSARMDNSAAKEVKTDNSFKRNSVEDADTKKTVAKDVAKAIDEVTEKIKDTFGISDEELKAAMETLGLTFQDLLDPSKLMNLMMEITNVTDSISLITDAELYGDVKSVMDFAKVKAEDIVRNNAISTEELQVILDDADLMEEAMVKLAEDKQKPAGETFPAVDNAGEGNGVIGREVSETPAVTVEVTNERSETGDNKPAADQAKESVADNDKAEDDTFKGIKKSETDPSKGRNEGFENASKFARKINNEAGNVSENIGTTVQTVTTTEVNSVGDIVETITTYSSVNPNEIASQITESVKVNYTPDTTTMEMQLHPATLGTVNMQFTANGGVVTAHILVENEAVKAAIEGQLIALQQSFEEQGQKVESIDVSIANYDLNKSKDQNEEQRNNEKQAKDNFRIGSRRRINLSELSDEEDTEDLSDEEKITRDMMERNGNTVDYTV